MASTRKSWILLFAAPFALAAFSCIPLPRIVIKKSTRATALAARIAPDLARIEAELERGPKHPGDDLLERVRGEIERILKEPELAAARDYVLLDEEALAARSPPHARPEALARNAKRGGDDKQHLQRLASRVSVLHRYAEDNDLQISICAVNTPQHPGILRLWPRSRPAAARETTTPGTLLVYRGLYSYRAASRCTDQKVECKIECDRSTDSTCPLLDLMTDSRPGLVCDFELGACSRSKKAKGCS